MPRQRPPEDSLPAALGRLIQSERKKHKLSQDALAALAGVSKAVIRRYEYGDRSPSWEVFFQLARAFELKPSQLMRRLDRWGQERATREAA